MITSMESIRLVNIIEYFHELNDEDCNIHNMGKNFLFLFLWKMHYL